MTNKELRNTISRVLKKLNKDVHHVLQQVNDAYDQLNLGLGLYKEIF